MKPAHALHPRDVTTLAIARDLLERSRPIGDAELVERLGESSLDSGAARASLARLEAAGQLRFGRSGWECCVDPPPLIFSPYGW